MRRDYTELPSRSSRAESSRKVRYAPPRGRGRRRSLDDEIRWSYELLETDERKVLARLSVFVGDVSHSLAEAVIVGDKEVLDFAMAIEGLVTKSMVRRTSEAGESRYLLLDTVRAFAAERLTDSNDYITSNSGTSR